MWIENYFIYNVLQSINQDFHDIQNFGKSIKNGGTGLQPLHVLTLVVWGNAPRL